VSHAVSAGWRPTTTLARAALVSGVLAAAAVILGRADLLVLATPFLVHTTVALVRRPGRAPRVSTRLDHRSVREGEGTRLVARLADAEDVEHAVVVAVRASWTAMRPAAGVVGATSRAADPEVELAVELSSERWGRRAVGAGSVIATDPWAGRVWGPHALDAQLLTTLPTPGVFDSHAPVPHPIGLVGTHQARRAGDGSELMSIRPFTAGDRLRRVRWPVSLRTGVLHVTSTVAEEDTAVLLLVDSGVEIGPSEGLRGVASSLDVAVRAAGAVAEHYLRRGDRVGLRVLGSTALNVLPFGGGSRHLRRVLDTLARIVPGEQHDVDLARVRFHVPPGTVVVVLSPMLSERPVAVTRTLAQRGLDVVVVDTLPRDLRLTDPQWQLAWRMRRLEREAVLTQLARAGIPVVAWRGPGTLDEVLRGLARRGRTARRAAR
jgi:uncharacterized protein (DUF58 family)